MSRKLITLFTILALAATGCTLPGVGGEGDDGTLATLQALQVQTTLEAIQRLTAEAAGQNPPAPSGGSGQTSVTDTPASEASATPEPSATSTQGVPMISVSVDTNCRVGPGNVYDYKGALLVGEKAEVLARDPSSNYYYIPNPDGSGNCWVWAQYATIEGDASALPVYTPPPTPTPTYTPTPELYWQGDWNFYFEVSGASVTSTVTQSGKTISGSFVYLGTTITYTGTVSADGKTVNGTWTNTSTSDTGPFTWALKKNINQFVGNTTSGGTAYAWCGYRTGASLPSPCLGP
ncbi:MAG: hypothetical protein HYZ26_01230 [Chloroflexi bacterium]|nr:hypothetical protein [Chloroflexota bacterium]